MKTRSAKYGCGNFVDLCKSFDTVYHNILLGKLKHYGIKGLAYSWFKSYLKDRKQNVSINGYNSKHLPVSLIFLMKQISHILMTQSRN